MAKAKRISIILPNLTGGGAERVSLSLANYFVESGYMVDLVLQQRRGDLLEDVGADIRIVSLEAQRVRNAIWPLVKYYKQEKPDAVLAMMWPLTVVNVIAAKLAGLDGRVVTCDHTTFSKAPILKSRLVRFFFKWSVAFFYPLASQNLAVSRGVAEDIANLGGLVPSSIKVIYNPIISVGSGPRSKGVEQAWSGFSGFKLVAVGALKWAKNYPCLLEAVAILKRNGLRIRLCVVGQGAMLAELEQKARALNIETSVKFVGFSKTPTAWMASADLLVLSSHYEGFGNVLVEAMAVGTQVVSVDCKSGPREILCDGKLGQLAPVDDPVALAAAIETGLTSLVDTKLLKARARDFAVERIGKEYLACLVNAPD